MADESTKSMLRRSSDRRFLTRWIVGDGIDIGCGSDSIEKLSDYFPLMGKVTPWDLPDGDAMLMASVPDQSFDFVHSSHCLEHLGDPYIAMSNWIRICKEGGHIVVTIPEEDMYEQGVWPSTFNLDHKWSFTIHKAKSWSPRSVNVTELLGRFIDDIEILKIEKLDSGFVYGKSRIDQSMGGLSESAIEFVLKKRVKQGALDQATAFAKAALAQGVGAKFSQAVGFHQAGDFVKALETYQAILLANPDHAPTLNNLSLMLPKDLAEIYLRRALQADGAHVDALMNLGYLLLNDSKPAEARSQFEAAVKLAADDGRVNAGLVKSLQALDEFAAAVEFVDARAALFAQNADILYLAAECCESLGLADAAIAYLDQVLLINPEYTQAHVLMGRMQFKKGDFARGAAEIAWIWKGRIAESQIGLFVDAAGQDIRQDGRTIIIAADSGLGDTLQFVRYASKLKALGANVVVECQEPLIRLLENMSGVDRVVALGRSDMAHDLRIPLHNLIGAFRTDLATIPNTVPYIQAYDAEIAAFDARMQAKAGMRVGVCWAGNPDLPRNLSRSIDPHVLAPLLAQQGVAFYSLQKDVAHCPADVTDWSGEFDDLARTAALVANLDLVICVDTAIAHLAGALGRKVWLLNRFDSCWRWLEERADSPWYPTMTQFRQAEPGSWDGVIAAVSDKLQAEVSQHAA